jgi:hypothetical protein
MARPAARAVWLSAAARQITTDANVPYSCAFSTDPDAMEVTYYSATPGTLLAILALTSNAPNCHPGEIQPQQHP